MEVVFLFVAVGELDRPKLLLVLVQFLLLTRLSGRAGLGLNLIVQGIGVGALVGEDVLDREYFRADVHDLFLKFVAVGLSRGVGLLESLLQLLILGVVLNAFYRLVRCRFGLVEERAVALFPFVLKSLPGPLSISFIPQCPEQRRHEQYHRDDVIHRIRLRDYWILLGDWLFRHQILPFVVGRSSLAVGVKWSA